MKNGFLKVAAGVPVIRLADCEQNAGAVLRLMQEAHQKEVRLLALPELVLTGATCGDLFLQEELLSGAEEALGRVREASLLLPGLVTVVGVPLLKDGRLYNTAAVLSEGRVLGVVPKQQLSPAEHRFFAEGPAAPSAMTLFGAETPFGGNLLFGMEDFPDYRFALALGEDLRSPVVSAAHAAAGARLLVGLTADPEEAGRPARRRAFLTGESRRLMLSTLTVNAGEGESSTDRVYSGHSLLTECGELLAESKPFSEGLTVTELDLGRVTALQRKAGLSPAPLGENHRTVLFPGEKTATTLTRAVSPFPFIPEEETLRRQTMEEILTIQAEALRRRVTHIGCRTVLLGISGGLDSTLALLAAVRAFDLMERPRSEIIAVTMPCFGTTDRTKNNAEALCHLLGVRFLTVNIAAAVRQHFADIGQDETKTDVTFENGQARERTQVLMDLANRENGIVVGTGDLSELALGWATYNGDHMSMYGVNASIPKTLARALVRYEAERAGDEALKAVLLDVVATPVSPELLPAREGKNEQLTEDLVGPYELHDFFLFYTLRYGFPPEKVLRLAERAFGTEYDRATLLKWLRTFYRRFFQQQFKRSCLPDGPQVGAVGLSPRGAWQMPSDALAALWLREVDALAKEK